MLLWNLAVFVSPTIDVAKIIEAASKSTLGIFALVALGIGVLAALFFRRAPLSVRVVIFFVLLSGAAALGRAVFVVTSEPDYAAYHESIIRGNSALNNSQLSVASDFYKQGQTANPKGWEAL